MRKNDSADHLHSETIRNNSLCGGACRLEIISTPNDDVYTGNFWIQFQKRFPIAVTAALTVNNF